jgi:hypothetical protein
MKNKWWTDFWKTYVKMSLFEINNSHDTFRKM